MLESVSKVTFEGLENDLKRSGIIPQKEIIPEDSRIQVQLRITDDWQNRPVDPYLIHGDGLEEIKLGMAVSEMKRNLSTHHRILMRKIMVGNRFETIIKIDDLQRQPLFFIYQKDEKIWGIEVVHHRYKTLRGIGIGSTLGMVRICYPDVSIVSLPGRLTYISSSDSQHENIKYLLLDDNRIDFTKNEFPFDLKINSILVGNSPFLKE
jgi:hypothetical protein